MLLACRFDGAYCPAASFCVQWHEGGGVSNSRPEFCVVMPRISREGDAPDFTCEEVGKAAWGRGFSAWVLCDGWCEFG
jgi:hypothetical protein